MLPIVVNLSWGDDIMISVCVDIDRKIVSLCPNDMSGNTGWIATDTDILGIDMTANLFDEHGAPMYKLVDGVAVERSIGERMKDWPEEPAIEQEVNVQQLRADVDYIAMETGVEL